MKKLIIISVPLIIGLIVIIGFVAGFIPWHSEATSPTISPTTQTPLPPSLTTTPNSPTATSPPSQSGEVKFDFKVTDISGSGFSRTVTAQLINVGSADAHNVWAKVQASSGGSLMKLSGQDYLRIDIGAIKAGARVTKQVELNFSIVDGLKISQQGVHLDLIISSDELSEAFSYDYQP